MSVVCMTPSSVAAVAISPTQATDQSTNESTDEAAANDLAQTALRAQNSEDYLFAAKQWEKLLTDFPNSNLVGKAHYNAGVCYVQTQQYQLAANQLSAAIPKLAADESTQQPQAHLYLGFSQLRLGQSLRETMSVATDPEAQKESNILLTTSTQTFAKLLEKFSDFVDADQAAFFQGNAFEDLGRLEDAEKSYLKMLTFPKQTFKFDGLFAIGNVNEQLGKFTTALEYYEKFREAADGNHPLLNEVNFRTAKSLLALAVAQTNQGDASSAVESYRSAEKLFAALVNSEASDPSDSVAAITDEAQYHQAYCATQLGEYQTAATLYEMVAARLTTKFRPQALVYAGRSHVQADQTDAAIANFTAALETDSPFATEAAVSLSNLYLKNNENQKSYDLTSQWIEKSADNPLLASLMLDQADAAYRLKEKRVQSPALYLAIVDKFTDHPAAPSALYNAAYAFLELNQLDDAIASSNRFEALYPDSDFLPDTLEVKSDALLLKEDSAASEIAFDKLISAFPDHEKAPRWILRSAVAKFLQQKYQPTVDLIQSKLAIFTDPKQVAEATHWLGASQFYLDQFEPAITTLKKSVAADPAWRSADETLLTLARAQFKTADPSATATIEQLIAKFPQSPLLAKAYYYLGENAYETKQYETAYKNFETVMETSTDSQLLPISIYNAAWSKLELGQFEESETLFTKLIAEFPAHELAEKSKIGRGAARRKTGNMEDSIADQKAFLATNPAGTAKFNALYELGLAQVEKEAWADAVATFEKLLAEEIDSPRADRYHYELAWANQGLNQPAKALEHFTVIAEKFPASPLAPESNFHLGTAAYQNDDFPAAIAAYEKCVAAEGANEGANLVREKALYKLGWANYKQEQYEDAFQKFSKQVELFPAGELFADGVFMVAESLFRQKKYDQAIAAYLVAKPAVDASESVDPKIKLLTMLHGAQSANKSKQWEAALQLVTPLTTTAVDQSFQYDAWLEIGTAQEGLGKSDEAMTSWNKAKLSNNSTGARAACMIGDVLFKQKSFDAAISEFKLVFYRFAAADTAEDIKPWVAYALYEAARCNFVQVADAPAEKKQSLVNEALKQFDQLIESYPDDRLAPEAKKQIEKLKQLQ